jgi:hypothetical protein
MLGCPILYREPWQQLERPWGETWERSPRLQSVDLDNAGGTWRRFDRIGVANYPGLGW